MRAYRLKESDYAEVEAIHERTGFDYKMPNLGTFYIKRGVRVNGKLVGAYGLKLQAETYLWLDPRASVATRYRVVLELSRSLCSVAYRTGIDCLVAYLPPDLPRPFVKLMQKLGWSRDREGWHSYSRSVE